MVEPGAGTFARLLRQQLASGAMAADDSVLVQFGGAFDEEVLGGIGFTNATYANINPGSPSTGDTSAGAYDAHRMPQADAAYDHVVAHSGLHHCSRPHEALHEMYRLARKSVLFVENQDSAMMRLATRAGVVSWFELPAVVAGDYVSGGVDGTGVPNFVYRWTRREVEKAVAAFDPAYDVPIDFHTEWNVGEGRVSSGRLAERLHLSPRRAERLLARAHVLLNGVASQQGNIFAAIIRKDLAVLRPWMVSPTAMTRDPDAGTNAG